MKPESRQFFKVLGARITQQRKEHDMTQAELARAIGVSQQSVFAYELGDRRVSVLMLVKLAGLFQISVEELMGIAHPRPDSERPSRKWLHHAERMRGLSKRISASSSDHRCAGARWGALAIRRKIDDGIHFGRLKGMAGHNRVTDGVPTVRCTAAI